MSEQDVDTQYKFSSLEVVNAIQCLERAINALVPYSPDDLEMARAAINYKDKWIEEALRYFPPEAIHKAHTMPDFGVNE